MLVFVHTILWDFEKVLDNHENTFQWLSYEDFS